MLASQQQVSVANPGGTSDCPSTSAPAAKPPVPSGSSPQLVEIEDAMRRAREMAARFMANASKDAAAQLHSASAEASSGPPPPPPPPPPPQAPPSRWAGPPAAPTLQPLKGPLVHDQQSHMPPPPQPQPGPGPPPAIPGVRDNASLNMLYVSKSGLLNYCTWYISCRTLFYSGAFAGIFFMLSVQLTSFCDVTILRAG